jgi:hypothetical protein
LYPAHKSMADFRPMHRDAVIAAGAELVRFARGCGLIRGEWIAIDGSSFALWRASMALAVEHPFATIKYRIFGHPRLLMRGLTGARVEIGIATMAYNLKRITNVLGAAKK